MFRNGAGNKRAEEVLRLALSHLEKARALNEEGARARAAGKIDDARYRTLQQFYAHHAERAREQIETLRAEHRRRAESLHRELQEVARRQMELSDRVTAREVSPGKANRLNREFERQLAELRATYAEESRLAAVERSEEVGGFIDRPLDAYGAPAAPARAARKLQVPSVGRLVTTVVALLMSLSAFAPWMAAEGQAHSLSGLEAVPYFQRLAMPDFLPLALLALAIALPLGAAAFAWMEARRTGARGQLLVGIAALALPLALVAVAAAVGDGGLFEILGGVRAGAVAYAAGAVMLIVLAVQRLRGAETAWGGTRALVGLLAMGAIVGVLAYALVVSEPAAAGVQFRIAPAEADTAVVSVSCANTGGQAIRLYVPWPEGIAGGPLVEDPRHAYGTSLYLREPGSEAFRLYPDSTECWTRRGAPLPPGASLVVEPGATEEFELNPLALRRAGLTPEAVRMTITNSRGQVIDEMDVPLP